MFWCDEKWNMRLKCETFRQMFIKNMRRKQVSQTKSQDWTAVPSWSCSQAVSKPICHAPLLCLQWKTPDDEQRNCPKHAKFYSKNKFEKLVHTWFVPKVMRMISLRNAEGPGKERGGQDRWRGNPGIQFDLPQLSPRLCSSRYVC